MLRKIPNTYIIIVFLIIISAVLTWFIPSGEYKELSDSTLKFFKIDKNPQSWQVFTSLQKGFIKQSRIIVFVLIIGGVFWVYNSTNSIHVGIQTMLRKLKNFEQSHSFSPKIISQIIIICIALVFSIFGAVFGMSEETIAFVGIIIPLVINMGYDSITGVCVVFVAAAIGFAGAVLNPFTVGIAQGFANLPLFSGIEYRIICWVVINIVGISYILIYTGRVYSNPEKSMVYQEDSIWRRKVENIKNYNYHTPKISWVYFIISVIVTIIFSVIFPKTEMLFGNTKVEFPVLPILSILYSISGIVTLKKSIHFFILNILLFTILYLVVGVLGYEWYINEISGLFLAGGILTGLVYGYTGSDLIKKLMEGAKDIFGTAIIIGLAGGIIVILEDGKIIHSLLYYGAGIMNGLGKIETAGVMYFIQTCINVFIPSGSAQAAITMPIMAPLSDLIGISRQTAVLIFQFGDGFTNIITPTSPVLLAVLGVAHIPYSKWFKWIWPFVLIMIITGFILLLPALFYNLKGF